MYKDHGHAIEAFHAILQDYSLLDKYKIEPVELKEKFLETLRHRLTSKVMKYDCEIDLTCFTFEGVDAIKSSLKAGLEINKELEEELSKQKDTPQEEDEEDSEEPVNPKDKKKKKKTSKKDKKDKKGPPPGIVTITLMASPTYSIAVSHIDKDYAIKRLNDTIELIDKNIKSYGGRLQIKAPPKSATVNK